MNIIMNPRIELKEDDKIFTTYHSDSGGDVFSIHNGWSIWMTLDQARKLSEDIIKRLEESCPKKVA